jgi:hypothetical protein
MNNIISKSLFSFIQGRKILGGVLVSNEVVDEAKRLNKELIILKRKDNKGHSKIISKYIPKNNSRFKNDNIKNRKLVG